MGGEIEASSRVGEGSAFTLRLLLPVTDMPAAHSGRQAERICA